MFDAIHLRSCLNLSSRKLCKLLDGESLLKLTSPLILHGNSLTKLSNTISVCSTPNLARSKTLLCRDFSRPTLDLVYCSSFSCFSPFAQACIQICTTRKLHGLVNFTATSFAKLVCFYQPAGLIDRAKGSAKSFWPSSLFGKPPVRSCAINLSARPPDSLADRTTCPVMLQADSRLCLTCWIGPPTEKLLCLMPDQHDHLTKPLVY